MEFFKAAVRLIVFAFVLVGTMITLAGTHDKVADQPTISAEKQEADKSFTASKQELVSTDLGPTG
ncbi:MAG: hypothetical protein QF790_02290 [Gammaproteobacteria bacterium]|nr:hypothetical protein [Gammaproteobacteria bacterium]MDP6615980.1 hypothetical protein [Gammaproteobacteria bacterium]MDP6694893.1 hypothetical protein [Gammaproteobacteria bacterium]MDP7041525.1 hypothetical protein [Gammaproteobacteria bacterium]